MKNKKHILLILMFCVPYAFLGVYIELYASGIWEVSGYLMVLVVPFIRAVQAAKVNKKSVIISGNILSWLLSYCCAVNYSTDKLRAFCTFLRPEDVVNVTTAVMLVSSCIGWIIQKEKLAKIEKTAKNKSAG